MYDKKILKEVLKVFSRRKKEVERIHPFLRKFIIRMYKVAKKHRIKLTLDELIDMVKDVKSFEYIFYENLEDFYKWIKNNDKYGLLIGIVKGDEYFLNEFKRIVEEDGRLDVNTLLISSEYSSNKYLELVLLENE